MKAKWHLAVAVLGLLLLVSPGSSQSVVVLFEIFFSKSIDSGKTFSTPTAGESKQPALGTEGARVFVAWADNTREPLLNSDGTTNVFLRASLDGGQSFLPKPVNVSTSTEFAPAERPALVVDGTTTPPTAFREPVTLGCPQGKKVLVMWTEAFAGTTQIFSNGAPDCAHAGPLQPPAESFTVSGESLEESSRSHGRHKHFVRR